MATRTLPQLTSIQKQLVNVRKPIAPVTSAQRDARLANAIKGSSTVNRFPNQTAAPAQSQFSAVAPSPEVTQQSTTIAPVNQPIQPASVTELVRQALNQRISQSNQSLKTPIQEALVAAQAGPDLTKFPGYGDISAQALSNVNSIQQQGLTNKATGLLGLQEMFGNRVDQELGTFGNILTEQEAARQRQGDEVYRQSQAQVQQDQFSQQQALAQQGQNWQQIYQQGQLANQAAQNAAAQAQAQAQQQAQQALQAYQVAQINQGQQGIDWQKQYQQGLLDNANRPSATGANPYDKMYWDATANPNAPRDAFGKVDPAYQQQLDQLKGLTSFAQAAPTQTVPTAAPQPWAPHARVTRIDGVNNNNPMQPGTMLAQVPSLPVAGGSAPPGIVNPQIYQQIMASPELGDSVPSMIKQSIMFGETDPQVMLDALASPELGLSSAQKQQGKAILQSAFGKTLSFTPEGQKLSAADNNDLRAYQTASNEISGLIDTFNKLNDQQLQMTLLDAFSPGADPSGNAFERLKIELTSAFNARLGTGTVDLMTKLIPTPMDIIPGFYNPKAVREKLTSLKAMMDQNAAELQRPGQGQQGQQQDIVRTSIDPLGVRN